MVQQLGDAKGPDRKQKAGVYAQPQEFIRPVWPAALTLLVVATGTTAGLSQPKSFDGAYKGSLECEQGGLEVFRMSLAISIRDGRVLGGVNARH